MRSIIVIIHLACVAQVSAEAARMDTVTDKLSDNLVDKAYDLSHQDEDWEEGNPEDEDGEEYDEEDEPDYANPEEAASAAKSAAMAARAAADAAAIDCEHYEGDDENQPVDMYADDAPDLFSICAAALIGLVVGSGSTLAAHSLRHKSKDPRAEPLLATSNV